MQLIEAVSKKTGKSFILDPRVAGNAVLVGIDPSKVTYPELLTILQVNGYAAVETGGMVRRDSGVDRVARRPRRSSTETTSTRMRKSSLVFSG